MIFDWDDSAYVDLFGVISWGGPVIATLVIDPPTIGGVVFADSPRLVFFGDTPGESFGFSFNTGMDITLHAGGTWQFHDGNPIQWHNPVYPDRQFNTRLPRTDFAGGGDL